MVFHPPAPPPPPPHPRNSPVFMLQTCSIVFVAHHMYKVNLGQLTQPISAGGVWTNGDIRRMQEIFTQVIGGTRRKLMQNENRRE